MSYEFHLLAKRLGIVFCSWVFGTTLVGWISVNVFYREHGAIAIVLIASFAGTLMGLLHALFILIKVRRDHKETKKVISERT